MDNPTACVVNLGCRVNRVESDRIASDLAGCGFRLVEEDRAELIVINTCAVTGEAEAKTRKAVRHALSRACEPQVIVTGCAVNLHAEQLTALSERVVAEPLKTRVAACAQQLFSSVHAAGDTDGTDPWRAAAPSRSRVGIKIQDGCNNRCSYCAIPLIRRRVSLQDAIDRYTRSGQEDKARLLSWRVEPYFDEYAYGDFADYYYGEMAPDTAYLTVWDILPADGGFVFVYPDDTNPDVCAKVPSMPNFFAVYNEGEHWCGLMECETVADLNDLTGSGRIRELIRVNEALHEKRYSQIADQVCRRGARVVMLAGPSSSGKTTSAHRLATQLRVYGKKPILMSLDDYYIDRDKIAPGPDGKLDLEHINTLDTDLFRQDIHSLLDGEEVSLPTFNFLTGRREWRGDTLRLNPDSVVIVEGLHGLNPLMLPENVDKNLIFRMYVSPLLPLNLDDHNRIPTSYLRLLRRIVRDYETRGSSVQRTLDMWDSVRQGEKRWIFPYQENADVIFNSSTLYELAVLKKHIFPLLTAVEPEEECYDEVRNIVKVLSYIQEADVDDEIPPTSLVREFIGGNTFYRKD